MYFKVFSRGPFYFAVENVEVEGLVFLANVKQSVLFKTQNNNFFGLCILSNFDCCIEFIQLFYKLILLILRKEKAWSIAISQFYTIFYHKIIILYQLKMQNFAFLFKYWETRTSDGWVSKSNFEILQSDDKSSFWNYAVFTVFKPILVLLHFFRTTFFQFALKFNKILVQRFLRRLCFYLDYLNFLRL